MSYTKQEKQQLLQIARDSIHSGLETGKPCEVELDSLPDNLKHERATFVTLHLDSALRGCIGAITATQPLAEDTAQRAFSSAFQDSRFAPVTAVEAEFLEISISILTPPEPIGFSDEEDLLQRIQPGIDGLILEEDYYRSVYLPSVWEMLPDKHAFLKHLKQKAGLPARYRSETLKISRFRTESVS